MKKNQNKIIFILVLLAGGVLIFNYTTRTYKKTIKKDMVCSPATEEPVKEKILQSDIPFLESLTRHFLILHY